MEDIDHLLAKSINIIFVDKIGDGIQKKCGNIVGTKFIIEKGIYA